jgi:hypothetical protein
MSSSEIIWVHHFAAGCLTLKIVPRGTANLRMNFGSRKRLSLLSNYLRPHSDNSDHVRLGA